MIMVSLWNGSDDTVVVWHMENTFSLCINSYTEESNLLIIHTLGLKCSHESLFFFISLMNLRKIMLFLHTSQRYLTQLSKIISCKIKSTQNCQQYGWLLVLFVVSLSLGNLYFNILASVLVFSKDEFWVFLFTYSDSNDKVSNPLQLYNA